MRTEICTHPTTLEIRLARLQCTMPQLAPWNTQSRRVLCIQLRSSLEATETSTLETLVAANWARFLFTHSGKYRRHALLLTESTDLNGLRWMEHRTCTSETATGTGA